MTLCPALLVTARHFRFISSRKNKDRGETTRNHSFTAVRFYRNLFPSALRSSDAAVTHCLRMSPDLRINTQIPPSQDISAAVRKLVSVVYGKRVPLLQWRDRAGLTPASILAFVKFAVIPKPEAAATWRKNINTYVIVTSSITCPVTF